jgi:GT2 family glycosyltransferase
MERITVCIPYKPGRQLAKAYNEAMAAATTEWVLLLDWDLFSCNPHWYDCCVSAIEQVGHEAGWITCVTNRIGSNSQKAKFFMDKDDPPPLGHDVMDHITYARKMHRKYNTMNGDGTLQKVDVRRFKGALSGFFILTSKTAWKAAGGFDEKRKRLMGVDNIYSRDVSKAGYRLMGMPGLYFYHVYREKARLWRTRGK